MIDPGRRPATLSDVARLAGVSRSTVSNVVRGADVVAPATRHRVLGAIGQLGYRPNALARQLLAGRARTIGIIARDLANPFIAEMASLVEREVAGLGFAAMFCATEGLPEREQQAVELMLDNRVSGLVFLSFLGRPAQIGATIDGRIPSVFIAAEEPWTDSVTVDELRGGEIVARHLVELGHRRLAFVGPHRRDQADSRRLEGFVRAARADGLEPLVVGWDPPDDRPSIGSAETTWREILSGSRAATGVFAANDFAAIDLLDVADALGIGVPRDLSVVGFDNVDMARLRRISLTTVSQPREGLVRLGVEALLGRMDGSRNGAARVTRLEVALQVRGSTGPPPAG